MGRIILLIWGATLLPGIAHAQDWRAWPLGERLKLSVGVFEPDIDTRGRLTQKDPFVPGTFISFEDDLGLDSSDTVVFASLDWRVFKRHTLRLNYYQLDRDANTRITDDIAFDGTIFPGSLVPGGLPISTTLNIDVYELAYSYSILFDERKDLYVGFGIAAQDYEFELFSPVVPAPFDETLRSNEEFVAPIPTLNIGYRYALSEKWLVGFKAGYMDLDIEIGDTDVDAEVFLADASLRWKVFRNFGLGFNYTIFDLNGDFEDDNNIGKIELEYNGPRLSFDLYF